MKKLILLVLLTGCIRQLSMTELSARTGYSMASWCLYKNSNIKTINVPYDDIKKKYFKYGTETWVDNELQIIFNVIASVDTTKLTIYMAREYRTDSRMWGHEYLHLLGHVPDHPDSLFKQCNLE